MSAAGRRRRDVLVAGLAAAVLLLVRASAPDDGWGYAQPRTMAYAVDLVSGGSWILPQDEAGLPATKPPLHPWLAAPIVAAAGPASWAAHRAPDIAAALLVAGLLIVAGGRWWPRTEGHVGAVAATIWLTSITGSKTALLARPDMLLTAAVTVAWVAFAAMVLRASETGVQGVGRGSPTVRRWSRRAWWIAAAAAAGGLAKGPAVLLLAPALWLAGRCNGPAGRAAWRAIARPGVLAAALLPPAAWLLSASLVDAAWVEQGLVRGEVLERVSGTMADAGGRGPIRLLETAHYMPFYLLVRFLPWTIPLVLATVLVVRPGLGVRPRGRRPADVVVPRVALVVVIATVLVFSLSAGKRADYLAPCLPAAAVAAAWWLVRGDRRVHARRPWAVPLAAAVLLALHAVHLRRPSDGLPATAGSAIAEIAREARRSSAVDGLPVMVLGSAGTSLPLRIGRVPADPPSRFGELLAEGRPFLVAHASLGPAPLDGGQWAAAHPSLRPDGRVAVLLDRRGGRVASVGGMPEGSPGRWAAWLIRVDPASPPPPSGSASPAGADR